MVLGVGTSVAKVMIAGRKQGLRPSCCAPSVEVCKRGNPRNEN